MPKAIVAQTQAVLDPMNQSWVPFLVSALIPAWYALASIPDPLICSATFENDQLE